MTMKKSIAPTRKDQAGVIDAISSLQGQSTQNELSLDTLKEMLNQLSDKQKNMSSPYSLLFSDEQQQRIIAVFNNLLTLSANSEIEEGELEGIASQDIDRNKSLAMCQTIHDLSKLLLSEESIVQVKYSLSLNIILKKQIGLKDYSFIEKLLSENNGTWFEISEDNQFILKSFLYEIIENIKNNTSMLFEDLKKQFFIIKNIIECSNNIFLNSVRLRLTRLNKSLDEISSKQKEQSSYLSELKESKLLCLSYLNCVLKKSHNGKLHTYICCII